LSAKVNPLITAALQHSAWVRAIVKVKNVDSAVPGTPDAPYDPGKKQALHTQGVRLVTDFDQLPALLVEIENTTALDALATHESVEFIDIEATYRPQGASPTR
jgi:hypothetical protein